VVNLAVLACVLSRTTEKGRQLFEKKCTQEKILSTPMCLNRNKKVLADKHFYNSCKTF